MSNFSSKIISHIKGESFNIDNRIPARYITETFIIRLIMLISGIIKMRRFCKCYIHTSARIRCKSLIKHRKNLTIDRGCYIDALSTNGISFGENVSIGKYTTIECTGTLKSIGKGLKVGDNVGLGTHGFFGCAGGVEIGDNTIFGNFVSIHSENHNFENIDIPIRHQGVSRKGIIIGEDCWIGAKSTILDGTIIGKGCIVAAGAVVRGEIPPYSIVGGVPAKIIKDRK